MPHLPFGGENNENSLKSPSEKANFDVERFQNSEVEKDLAVPIISKQSSLSFSAEFGLSPSCCPMAESCLRLGCCFDPRIGCSLCQKLCWWTLVGTCYFIPSQHLWELRSTYLASHRHESTLITILFCVVGTQSFWMDGSIFRVLRTKTGLEAGKHLVMAFCAWFPIATRCCLSKTILR